MSGPAYMPLYVADYLVDTHHLDALEHGAYLLLIMAYWQRREPLPDDDVRLARLARVSVEAWAGLRGTVAEFFLIGEGVWRHKRIDAELSRYADKAEKARAAGQARQAAGRRSRDQGSGRTEDRGGSADAQRTLSERSPNAERTLSERSANDQRTTSQSESESESEPDYSGSDEPGAAAPSDPDDPKPPGSGRAGSAQLRLITLGPVSDPTDACWREGLEWLAEATGQKRDRLRNYFGRLMADFGAEAVLSAVRDAARDPPGDPKSWLRQAAKAASDGITRHGGRHDTGPGNSMRTFAGGAAVILGEDQAS